MPIVVDVSIVAPWLLADEHHVLSVALLDRLTDDTAVVPAVWHFEFGNLLVTSRRRNRLAEDECRDAIALIGTMGFETDHTIALEETLSVAGRRQLSFYDAAYLELALRRDLTLATLDRQLAIAAQREGVVLLA